MKMPPLEKIASNLSQKLLNLDPGPLAELRRMEPGGAGVPSYWRLANECDFREGDADVWMRVVKVMAILTPKGQRNEGDRLHDARRGLGAVLCDGGDLGWPGDEKKGPEPRPFFSEKRMARLLSQPAARRGESLERISRVLASSRDPASGVNCVEIAALLRFSEDKRILQNIARDYYRRLDLAARTAKQEESEA